jgi:hypothetical protein
LYNDAQKEVKLLVHDGKVDSRKRIQLVSLIKSCITMLKRFFAHLELAYGRWKVKTHLLDFYQNELDKENGR